MAERKIITIIGGSGFVGGYVANALAKAGHLVNIASRNPEKALFAKTAGMVGQVSLAKCNVRKPDSIKAAIANSDVVINLTGILFQSGKQRFGAVHAKGAETVAQEAQKAGVKQFIHVSALGVDKAVQSNYARTKFNGEKAVLAAFPGAVIVRPSIIFGVEDQFFNRFAKVASIAPALPLIGGGKTKFQPVYVNDVAEAIVRIIENGGYQGAVFELGGAKTYSFRELMEFVLKATGRKRFLVSIPVPFAKYAIAGPSELLPTPPLTRDQVTLLQYDNVVSDNATHTFKTLGIKPAKVEDVVPKYLDRYQCA